MSEPMRADFGGWPSSSRREILRRHLPQAGLVDRGLIRGLVLLGRSRVRVESGLEHVDAARDPFILALNHITRRETLLVPATLILHRGGRLIHFVADWNFRLIPGIGLIYRRAQTITVTRKPAQPRVLNVLRSLYRDPLMVVQRARNHLLTGQSIGIFPEARVNRDPVLLKGRTGAAFLSLGNGVPVIPAGIRVCRAEAGDAKPGERLEIRIGPPLQPPRLVHPRPSIAELRAWHAVIMTEISRLSGKAWVFAGREQRYADVALSSRAA
jgi:1-acyl-sn-glycerol-3-phosphate acyltransferase